MDNYEKPELSLDERAELKSGICDLLIENLRQGDFRRMSNEDLQDFTYWLVEEEKALRGDLKEAIRDANKARRELQEYISNPPKIPDEQGIIDRLRALVVDQQKQILRLTAQVGAGHEL